MTQVPGSRGLACLGAVLVLLGMPAAAAADDAAVAVFDLRPVKSGGQTDLERLSEAVRIAEDLRKVVRERAGVTVWSHDEVRAALGNYYRVEVFECREDPACTQPKMLALGKRGVSRVLLGTIDVEGDRATLTLYGVNTATGAYEKVELLELRRDVAIDADAAAKVVLPLLGLEPKAAQSETETEAETETETETETDTETGTKTETETETETETDTGEDLTETLIDPDADVTESLLDPDGGGGGGGTAPLPPPPPPPVPDRISVSGWARASAVYSWFDGGLREDAPDPTETPFDPVVSRNQMLVSFRYQRGTKFTAAGSGVLEWSLFEQPPGDPDETFTGINGQDLRSSFTATLRELYVGWFWKKLDLRVGNQRIAWGKGDVVSPNDVVNGRDLRDQLLSETELRYTPSFVVRGDINLGSTTLQLVGAPFFVPDHYDVYGSNWAAIQPDAPEAYRGFMFMLSRQFDPSLYDDIQDAFRQTARPKMDLTDASGGARLVYIGHEVDASLYYHFGFDGTPSLSLDPMFAQAIGTIDWRTATYSDLAPVFDLLDAGIAPFTADYKRRHHVGFDGVTTLGPFALRVDAAYQSNRVFYQRDLVSFESPTVAAIGSVEYQTGEIGKLFLVEGVYYRTLDPLPAGGLLGYARNTYGAAAVLRWTWDDRVEAEVRAFGGVEPRTYIVRPQLGYKVGTAIFRVGALLLGGKKFSVGDYYDRNNSAYVNVKYAF